MKNEVKHSAHSGYRRRYHIVFAPKCRIKVIFQQICKDIGEVLRKLCNEMRGENIVEFTDPGDFYDDGNFADDEFIAFPEGKLARYVHMETLGLTVVGIQQGGIGIVQPLTADIGLCLQGSAEVGRRPGMPPGRFRRWRSGVHIRPNSGEVYIS